MGELGNEVYHYDLLTDSCDRIETQGDRPGPRQDHGAINAGNTMLIFGGQKEESIFPETLDDVWQLDLDTLRALWREAGLAPEAFAEHEDPEIRRRVLAEHEDALALGVTGVPAVMAEPQRIPIVGALPIETYRRWMERLLAAPPSGAQPQAGPEAREGSP